MSRSFLNLSLALAATLLSCAASKTAEKDDFTADCLTAGRDVYKSCRDGCDELTEGKSACRSDCIKDNIEWRSSCLGTGDTRSEDDSVISSSADDRVSQGPRERAQAHVESDGTTFVTSMGTRLSCIIERPGLALPQGASVPVQVNANVPSTGWTTLEGGRPLIRFRSDIHTFTDSVQTFLFQHECGHVNSGDGGPNKEISANCWGARHSSIDEAGWQEVRQALLRYFPNARPPYPAGTVQWQLVQRCRQ